MNNSSLYRSNQRGVDSAYDILKSFVVYSTSPHHSSQRGVDSLSLNGITPLKPKMLTFRLFDVFLS